MNKETRLLKMKKLKLIYLKQKRIEKLIEDLEEEIKELKRGD